MPEPVDCAFLVNTRSGGHRGARLAGQLRQVVGQDRVAELHQVDLKVWTGAWSRRSAALVACGGDGTLSALLDATWKGSPGGMPVGIFPLGTGNDLARVAGAPLSGSLETLLAALRAARPFPIDRWLLKAPWGERAWFNYCSWGCDARIATRFHTLRDNHPRWFRTRLGNLLAYAGVGLQDLGSRMALEAVGDDGPVPLPEWMRSLVLLNIPSYAGGRHLGGVTRVDDGRVDAFALGSGVAMGIGLSGIRHPRRLGSHDRFVVNLRRAANLQLDGEPLPAPPGPYQVVMAGACSLLRMGTTTAAGAAGPAA